MADLKKQIYQYLQFLGDNSMILGHRLSELCGHGPNLETDIALTNISLDLFGQVRNYFLYASEITGDEKTEDDIAFLRYEHDYKNCLLVEQPNTDFAHVITRQFFYDAYHLLLMQALSESNDKRISAIARKSIKEVRYHLRFSSEWVKRLGGGTAESHSKMQAAINHLWKYVEELTIPTTIEAEMLEFGIGADLAAIKPQLHSTIKAILNEVDLEIPETPFLKGGKTGMHSEHLGYILSDFQYMQRAYPNMKW